MNEETTPSGIAMICTADGRISRVLRDQLQITAPERSVVSFLDMLDAGNIDKGESFLDSIRTGQATFEWELNLPIDDRIETLFFAGGMIGNDEMVLIGARSRHDIDRFYDELMQINNEQATALRQALKDRVTRDRTVPQAGDYDLYNELSRLNNELATAQRELARKNAELEQLNIAKNQLLGMAAHDLRNPLSVIMLYSEVLEGSEGEVIGTEHLEYIRSIRTSTQQMLRIINDLLDVSKIQAGKLELKRESVDITQLIEHNILLNGKLAERSGIKLLLEVDDDLPMISIDAPKIDQVLNNIISNAIKFSQSGTTITVKVKSMGDNIVIAVRDQGPGIPEAELEKIFRPYERTSVRSVRGEWSSGLGLAIAKKIVDAHGGRIHVESTPGKGSTFYVELPVKQEKV